MEGKRGVEHDVRRHRENISDGNKVSLILREAGLI